MTAKKKPATARAKEAGGVGLLLDQEFELVDVDSLLDHPMNDRVHDDDAIGESLVENGFFGAVVVQRSTRFVLDGHGRKRNAQAAGARMVPVLWVDVDDEAALAILAAANETHDRGSYDAGRRADLVAALGETRRGLAGSGFTPESARAVMAAARRTPQLNDPDDAPDPVPLEREPISAAGDVWLLGPHRLVCGDATDPAVVRLATAGRPVDLLWTDPPYGVKYVGGTKDKLTIAGDNFTPEELRELLEASLSAAAGVMGKGAPFYLCSPPGDLELVFRLALIAAGLVLHQQIVWVKDRFVLGRMDYHWQQESVLYGWPEGNEVDPPHYDGEHGAVLYGWRPGGGHPWHGGRKQSTVWEHARPSRSAVHPTMKPVALAARAIANSTTAGGLVLDLFAGSGTVAIACSDHNRDAALVELDPRYCDVTCRRFQEHTGFVPVLEATGKPRDFTGLW